METYHPAADAVLPGTPKPIGSQLQMPAAVTIAMDQIAGACKEGLLAMAVSAGLEVMRAMFEESVTAVAGPKGKHDPRRQGVRHGSEAGAVTLGGRRVPVRRPRVRSADGAIELAVPAYEHFAGRDQLAGMALERMLAGLSTRRYGSGLEPIGSETAAVATGTSKSAVSRRFVALTSTALKEMMDRRLDDIEVAVLMLDGVNVADHLCVVALAVDAKGNKIPVGLVEGATENSVVVTGLLEDLVARGLDLSRPILFVLDGSRALVAAVRRVCGKSAVIQRCQEHKLRNVLGHLPDKEKGFAERKLRAAYRNPDATQAKRDLEGFAAHLDRQHPGAAGSLREGLAETLTVNRLQIGGTLRRTLRSTNPIESMIGTCRTTARNVKRFRDGEMALRWTAAGMSEAQKRFRRVKGHRDMAILAAALAREVMGGATTTAKRVA